MNSFNWSYPTEIRVGAGRVCEIEQCCQKYGITRPLFVTDQDLVSHQFIKDLYSKLCEQFPFMGLFSNIKGNPTEANVTLGTQILQDANHDGVIVVGGGSALDAAKAMAFMNGQKERLWSFEDTLDSSSYINTNCILPVIAVPTTAGTGSEVGRASVITDIDSKVKRTIFHQSMLPKVAILDAQIISSLPKHLTAATGADALTHCIETFLSPVYHPMADSIALRGFKIISENLEKSVNELNNLDARQNMLIGSAMGATAFPKGLGGVHAIAQSLGAVYDKHHGLLNAIILPYMCQANIKAISKRIPEIGFALGVSNLTETRFIDWLLSINASIGIPSNLSDIGIDTDLAELIGKMASADGCSATNPIEFSEKEYSNIFKKAVMGRL